MRYHGLSTRCSLSSRLLSSIFSFIAQTTEIIKDQNAPRHKHTHTHEASFVVSFVITAIESNVLSFRVPLLCIQRVCSCAHLCGFSILFLWPKERVHCACVCVCLFVCRFLFFYSWFGLVCFGFCYWCNHKNRTACVCTRTHGRMHLNDSLHPSQWLLIGQFLCRVNVMHFEKFCGAINTTQQNSSATFSIKNDTL